MDTMSYISAGSLIKLKNCMPARPLWRAMGLKIGNLGCCGPIICGAAATICQGWRRQILFSFKKRKFLGARSAPKRKNKNSCPSTQISNRIGISFQFSSLSSGLCLCTGPSLLHAKSYIHCCLFGVGNEWHTGWSYPMLQPGWLHACRGMFS